MVIVRSELKTKYAAKLEISISERASIEMHVETVNIINININININNNVPTRS
jgi:hypothetical protein